MVSYLIKRHAIALPPSLMTQNDLPTRHSMQTFLSVHALIDGCMDRMVGVLIDSGINELAGPELEKIQALGSELA